ERFTAGATDNKKEFDRLAGTVDTLEYQGYITSSNNNYQVNLTLDDCIAEQICLAQCECISDPTLKASPELAQAVGRNADLLVRVPLSDSRIIVEIEKANKEKIPRDIIKMLLFFDAG